MYYLEWLKMISQFKNILKMGMYSLGNFDFEDCVFSGKIMLFEKIVYSSGGFGFF